ncbi:MAG: hypothetical protein HY644_12880 [Acidobacteria bacterium]|nr:hypothetical protein [Acidobacteriota bacterium]
MFYCIVPGVVLGADDAEINRKLQEFEARLKRLEEKQGTAASGRAETAQAEEPRTVEVAELRRQLDVLAAELEKLRSGEQEIDIKPDRAQAMGLGPSAASVYRKTKGVSLAGYGEMLYENFADQIESGSVLKSPSQLDFLRAVLYTGYRFNDKFVFNSELEAEHANEVGVEFAYLDYLAHKSFTLRGGLLLVPMGLINEFHEPNVFLGARRTETENRIIPSTWRENGFGVLGSAGIFNYRAYIVNGLDAKGFSSDGLRGGRQKGSRAKASDLAFVGRLDIVPTPGLYFGGSIYAGGSGQDQFTVDGRDLNVKTTLGEFHGQIQWRGTDVRGLYARAVLDDVAELNKVRNLTGKASIGETMQGGYLQVGYNILSQFRETPGLTPYYRFETLNTQHEVPPGFSADGARDRTFHTLGFEFRPIYPIVIKTDYQWSRNKAKSGLNQFNLAIGYAF